MEFSISFKKHKVDPEPVSRTLIEAIENRRFNDFVKLLRSGHNPNEYDKHGTHILLKAPGLYSFKFISVLISYDCDLNVRDKKGNTPLILSISEGEEKLACELIKNGCELDLQDDEYGNTALHLASVKQMPLAIRALIKYGCNPFVKNNGDFTALRICSIYESDRWREGTNTMFIYKKVKRLIQKNKMLIWYAANREEDSVWFRVPLDVVKYIFDFTIVYDVYL